MVWPAGEPLHIKRRQTGVKNEGGRHEAAKRCKIGKKRRFIHVRVCLYEADHMHPSVISSRFLLHYFYFYFYGEFATTAVIRRKKRVVSPGVVSAGFYCMEFLVKLHITSGPALPTKEE